MMPIMPIVMPSSVRSVMPLIIRVVMVPTVRSIVMAPTPIIMAIRGSPRIIVITRTCGVMDIRWRIHIYISRRRLRIACQNTAGSKHRPAKRQKKNRQSIIHAFFSFQNLPIMIQQRKILSTTLSTVAPHHKRVLGMKLYE